LGDQRPNGASAPVQPRSWLETARIAQILRQETIGGALHLDLTLGTWSAEKLLAICFVAWLELKCEFVAVACLPLHPSRP
jgi:hypothetical protein